MAKINWAFLPEKRQEEILKRIHSELVKWGFLDLTLTEVKNAVGKPNHGIVAEWVNDILDDAGIEV